MIKPGKRHGQIPILESSLGRSEWTVEGENLGLDHLGDILWWSGGEKGELSPV